MSISIVITTYNRAEELRLTLASLSQVDGLDDLNCEVLVVANNCTDHTEEVTREAIPLFGSRLRYIEEPRQGLSHGRNRAISEAQCDIVAFLDDDVDVDSGWLRALAAAYAGGDYAAVGGKAHLVYPAERPRWLGDRLEGYLSKVDHGSTSHPAEPDDLFGLNLSFRKDWLDRVGWFRTDQGRVGKCLLGGEETDLLRRIVDAGGQLLYEPSAVVGHRVAPERLHRRWFLSRCYWGQVGASRVLPEHNISLYALVRATWHLSRTLGGLARSFFQDRPGSEEFFFRLTRLASWVGNWVGLAGQLVRRSPLTPWLAPRAAHPATS